MSSRAITRSLDLRGEVCPGPTVDTRLTLKEMNPGEVLEVITDYYPARQTIPALMTELGYSCELVDGDKQAFRVIIEKGSNLPGGIDGKDSGSGFTRERRSDEGHAAVHYGGGRDRR